MKQLILVLALALGTHNAFGGNEGPNAAPIPPTPVLAKVVTSIFFKPPQSPRAISIEVLADGRVLKVEDYDDGSQKVKNVARLAAEVVKGLALNVEKVTPGELVHKGTESSMCQDAPTTTYVTVHSDQTEIAVAQRANCVALEKQTFEYAEQKVKQTLESLEQLSHLLNERE